VTTHGNADPHGNAHGELNVAPPHGVAEHFWLHHV